MELPTVHPIMLTYLWILCCVLQDFDALSMEVNMEETREVVSKFIMDQIVKDGGEFHYDPTKDN